MKKRLFLLSLLAVLALLVNACAPAATPTTAPAAQATEAPTQAPAEATTAPAAAGDAWGDAVIPAGQTIKVGMGGPMTGDYAAFGIDISRGAELAIAAHLEVKGFEIELLVEDTQGSPEQGAAVANKWVTDETVVAVDGHIFSGETEASIPIYERAGIPMVSPSATTPSLTTLGSQVFNRVVFTDEMQGQFAAEYLYNELGVRQIAVMHDGSQYGQGLAEVTAKYFEEQGGEVLGSEAITPGETDYSAALAAVSALSPELVYFGGYDSDAAVLVSQMAGAGLGDALFFGCDGTYGTNYLNLAGASAEGSYSTYVPIPESDAFAKFQADYQTAYGDEQGKLSPFSPHGHDAMAVIIAAIEQVAKPGDNGSLIINRAELVEAIRSTTNFQGLTGTLSCSETGECAAASVQFMVVSEGEWVKGPGQ